MRRMIYAALGCGFTAIGAIGVVLPFLPSVPFFTLAAFFFAGSSQRLHDWLTGTKMYKDNIEGLVKGTGMKKAAKLRVILLVTLLMGAGFMMMHRVPAVRAVLLVVWLFHVIGIGWLVKNKEE